MAVLQCVSVAAARGEESSSDNLIIVLFKDYGSRIERSAQASGRSNRLSFYCCFGYYIGRDQPFFDLALPNKTGFVGCVARDPAAVKHPTQM